MDTATVGGMEKRKIRERGTREGGRRTLKRVYLVSPRHSPLGFDSSKNRLGRGLRSLRHSLRTLPSETSYFPETLGVSRHQEFLLVETNTISPFVRFNLLTDRVPGNHGSVLISNRRIETPFLDATLLRGTDRGPKPLHHRPPLCTRLHGVWMIRDSGSGGTGVVPPHYFGPDSPCPQKTTRSSREGKDL